MSRHTKASITASHEDLRAWLRKHNALQQWSVRVKFVGHVDCYLLDGSVVLVLRYDVGAWDMFVPASADGRISVTLEAAEAALGLS